MYLVLYRHAPVMGYLFIVFFGIIKFLCIYFAEKALHLSFFCDAHYDYENLVS